MNTPDILSALDPNACRQFFIHRLHPDGLKCPHCGSGLTVEQTVAFKRGNRVHCAGCGRWFTWRTKTPHQGIKAEERQLYLFEYLDSVNLKITGIAKHCGVSIDTIRRWRRL